MGKNEKKEEEIVRCAALFHKLFCRFAEQFRFCHINLQIIAKQRPKGDPSRYILFLFTVSIINQIAKSFPAAVSGTVHACTFMQVESPKVCSKAPIQTYSFG